MYSLMILLSLYTSKLSLNSQSHEDQGLEKKSVKTFVIN